MNHNEIGRDVVDRPTSLSLFLLLVLVAIPGASAGLYVVDVDLPPQNPVHNVVVTYSLPVGVIYKTGSFSASGASISSHQEVVSTPNDGSAPVTVTWTIESVYNTGNQDLEIQFDGIVANVTGNQDGVQLPPGTVSYTYDGGLGAKTGRSQPTEIVEPDLTILKRRSRETQGQVTFELMVYHTPKSHSDAHDVVITDVLPNNMRYVPNSIEIIAGPSGTTIVSGADLTWNFPLIGRSWESGNEVKLEYKANKGQTSSSTTPRTLVWTSAEGAGYGEDRFYTLRFNETVMIVSISCSAESVTVGKEITYTYTITNIGAARVDNVQLTNKSGSIIPLTPTPTSLETGESATGLENYIVQESDLPGPLVNTATVTGTDRYGRSVSAVGTISVPFGIDPLNVRKTALNKTVARGGNVTYIIEIENNGISGSDPPTNITVEDVFSMPVEILSASPPPGMDGLWRFPKIDPGSSEKITLVVRVPEKQDFNFTSVSGVSGSGFVNAASFYTTSLDPFPLKNCVYVTFFNSTFHDGTGTTGRNETISDCETVTVGRAGTELSTREHGSGAYESADLVKMVTKNDLISLEKDMAATYGATTLTLPRNRTVTYSSRWTGEAMAKNRVTGASMAESYRYATTLDRESKFFLNENESEMEIDAEFDGMAHIGFLKMPTNKSTFKATPIFESREDYAGSFRVIERVDEYGSAASSERSAEGLGLVAVDKRIGAVQRSYEHGTGAYSSEELIRTYTNYIAKEISLKYSPTGLRLTDGASANVSGKWKEGMSSASPGTSLIAEEYTSITELDKETVARGLNEMETEADFTGRARYRTIAKSGSWSGGGPIYIRDINFADEWVEIANRGDDVVNMTGWNLSDDDGHGWPFPYFVLCPGRSVRVHTFSGTDTGTDLFMNMDGPIWNDDGDCAILKDANGNLVDKKCTNDELGYEIDFDEIYEGDYSIARRILLSGAPKYDRPHLNVTKSLEGIEEEAVPWGRDEPHLPGEKKTRKVAAYAITIANDGNRALGPIRVQDLFPTGASYLRSSLRPTEVTAESCNWTLTHLAIGDVAEIEIELDVTGCPGPELINRVAVCGGEGGEGICAASSSVHEIGWLSWPSDEISAAKTEELDEA
ncbi:MAG: lamin tail domain-containing protein, partial [Methanothrix sp.]|nr:lamin tail domain-containing protein [Methanothrix sp.]